MYQKPKSAKRLYFDVIPRNVDEYLTHVEKFEAQDETKKMDSPAWHIHAGYPPNETAHLSYNILLNLASVCHTDDKAVLWHFIGRYRPGATPDNAPILDKLVEYAINYYRDFIRPSKQYRQATKVEKAVLEDLVNTLKTLPADSEGVDIQSKVYEVGKRHYGEKLKDWFRALYEILLGQTEGPRMGSFIALYGMEETLTLLHRAIEGEDLRC